MGRYEAIVAVVLIIAIGTAATTAIALKERTEVAKAQYDYGVLKGENELLKSQLKLAQEDLTACKLSRRME